jgi:hypothetical protein
MAVDNQIDVRAVCAKKNIGVMNTEPIVFDGLSCCSFLVLPVRHDFLLRCVYLSRGLSSCGQLSIVCYPAIVL